MAQLYVHPSESAKYGTCPLFSTEQNEEVEQLEQGQTQAALPDEQFEQNQTQAALSDEQADSFWW
jgi:hypothetical protein